MRIGVLFLSVLLCLAPRASAQGEVGDWVIEQLVEGVKDGTPLLRTSNGWINPAEALLECGPWAVLPLLNALRDCWFDEGRRLSRTLQLLGPECAPANDVLVRLIENDHSGYFETPGSYATRILIERGEQELLLELLDHPNPKVRAAGARAFASLGRAPPEVAGALARGCRDSDVSVRLASLQAVNGLKEWPYEVVTAVTDTALRERFWSLREPARTALGVRGKRLKENDQIHWWVLPYAYRRELIGGAIGFVLWFALCVRFPRHRPRRRWALVGLFVLVAAPPTALGCWGAVAALTPEWAAGFLPDPPITQLPVPVAGTLSVALLTVMASIGAVASKRPPREEVGPVTLREPDAGDS